MQLFDGIYRLEERLDQGASAEVWKATDTLTDTTLALKIYSPNGGMGTNGMQMMAHEFRIMVNVSHQNLLKPLHFGLFEGRPYLVLPYCQRGNINKLRGTFDEQRAWTLIRDVAGGLAHLHSMKPPLIHQDIKPANILIADNGDYMLTDFGVSTYAKANISRGKEKNALLSAGTVAYMASEKFKTGSTPIMSSDIWSLGATVYEMLTGDLPFGNDGGLTMSANTEIPQLPDSFSPTLNSIITSCLAYESWNRPKAKYIYETATEALRNLENNQPVNSVQSTVKPTQEPEPIADPAPEPIPEPMPEPEPVPDPTPTPPKPNYILITAMAVAGIAIGIALALIV